jgi:nucleoside diphosphate kinase
MIKPDAVQDGHSGSIIKMIEAAGFRIVALKKRSLLPSVPESFTQCTKSVLSIMIFASICRPVRSFR